MRIVRIERGRTSYKSLITCLMRSVEFPSVDSYQENICSTHPDNLVSRSAANSNLQAFVNNAFTLWVQHVALYIMMELINNIACFPIFAMAL